MSGLLKFITCGSVDDGKSTLIGHNSFIIYRCNAPLPPKYRPLPLPRKCHRLSGHGCLAVLGDWFYLLSQRRFCLDLESALAFLQYNFRVEVAQTVYRAEVKVADKYFKEFSTLITTDTAKMDMFSDLDGFDKAFREWAKVPSEWKPGEVCRNH